MLRTSIAVSLRGGDSTSRVQRTAAFARHLRKIDRGECKNVCIDGGHAGVVWWNELDILSGVDAKSIAKRFLCSRRAAPHEHRRDWEHEPPCDVVSRHSMHEAPRENLLGLLATHAPCAFAIRCGGIGCIHATRRAM